MLPEKLQSFVSIQRRLVTSEATGGRCKGVIQLDPALIQQLKELLGSELIEPTARQLGKTVFIDQLADNATGELEITLAPFTLRKHGVIYFENTDELIAQFRATRPDKPFYVRSFDFFSASGFDKPQQLQCYDDVQTLVEFLKSIADVCVPESNDAILHFFAKTQLEVPVQYGKDDICLVPSLLPFIAKFRQPETRDQQAQILKSVLAERLRSEVKERRFAVILRTWASLVESFEHSYKLYLQNFSWEKLRGEIEKEKFELTKKISSAVSEIQTKLIAIPAAITLAATQISGSESWIRNFLVLVGAFVFSVLVELLLQNQRRYLNSVKTECARVHERLIKDYPTIDGLASEWASLDTAIVGQRNALTWISICNWAVPVGTLVHIAILFFTKQ